VAKRLFDNRIALCEKSYDALAGADALAVVTEWNEFREPDFTKMRSLLRAPVVFDGRNIYSPEQVRALGFTYFSIGR
jgi:UDPglucose 6-dehydrogenase